MQTDSSVKNAVHRLVVTGRNLVIIKTFLFLLLFNHCSSGENNLLILREIIIEEDCAYYSYILEKGELLFRYSMSGACEKGTPSEYLNGYDKFITKYNDSFNLRRGGFIILDYDSYPFGINQLQLNKIIRLTKDKLNYKKIEVNIEHKRIKLSVSNSIN